MDPRLPPSVEPDRHGRSTHLRRAGPKILKAILEDPNIDVLGVPIPGATPAVSDRFTQDLVDAARNTDKPVCVVWGSPTADEPGYREVLLPSGLRVVRPVGHCLTAATAYFDYLG